MVRLAVIRAGEVPIAQLVQPDRPRWIESGRAVIGRIRQAFGGGPWAGRPHEALTVRDLMRQNVRSIHRSDDFLQVLEFIEQSRHHVYPVVSGAGELAGVIRYREIQSGLFNPEMAALVRAEDLCHRPEWTLMLDQPLEEALGGIERTSDDAIPVVSADHAKLIGIVEPRDVVRFVKRRHVH